MKNEIILNGKPYIYELNYKKVKNINLRIKPDGIIYVSANKNITRKIVEEVMLSKSDFIVKALDRFSERKRSKEQFFSENELRDIIVNLCKRVYPYFEKRGVGYPQIKFRSMISQWGSCNTAKGILTFNTNLVFAPYECIEYVVLHEFTHFLKANHSAEFYDELQKVCPKWKTHRKRLKEIVLG